MKTVDEIVDKAAFVYDISDEGRATRVIVASDGSHKSYAANEEIPMIDSVGQSFNAEIHMIDDDGKPRTTTTGKFRKIPKSKRVQQDEAAEELYSNPIAQNIVSGYLVFEKILLQDKFEVPEDQELLAMSSAVDRYLDSTGSNIELTPFWAMMSVFGARLLPQLATHDGFKEKAWSFVTWPFRKLRKS